MIRIETMDAQNTLARMKDGIYLNVENPGKKLKSQYRIVQKAIIDLHGALDDLNDLKRQNDEK